LSVQQKDIRYSAIVLWSLFFGAVGIGFAAIFVRLSQVGPTATAFWRMALAFPFLWIFLNFERRKHRQIRKPSSIDDYRRLILPGIFFACDLAVWHTSINYTTVANATLLANFMPIFVTLFSFLLFGTRFSKTFLAGMIMALSGAVFLVGANLGLKGKYLLGDALGLLTAVFYAGYILAVKGLRKDFSTATIMSWNALTICIVLIPVILLAGEKFIPTDLTGWLVLLGYASISQIGGQVLIAYALAHLSAAFSAVSLLLQPVVAAIAAWIIFNEAIGPLEAFGGVLVLIGIYTARKGSRLF